VKVESFSRKKNLQWGSSRGHELDNPHPLISKNESRPSIEAEDHPLQCLRADKGNTLATFYWFQTSIIG
jgi:hypothetical protein